MSCPMHPTSAYGCKRCDADLMRAPEIRKSNDTLRAENARLRALLKRCADLLVRYENNTIRPEVGTGEAITFAYAALAREEGT